LFYYAYNTYKHGTNKKIIINVWSRRSGSDIEMGPCKQTDRAPFLIQWESVTSNA